MGGVWQIIDSCIDSFYRRRPKHYSQTIDFEVAGCDICSSLLTFPVRCILYDLRWF